MRVCILFADGFSSAPTRQILVMAVKKSFYLFNDSLSVLSELSDEQAGKLFKAIAKYNLGESSELDGLMKAIFIPFKNQFDRDFAEYDRIVERNTQNGTKGGRPRETKENPSKPSGFSGNPKNHDKDKDNDTDNDNNTSLRLEQFEKFWQYYKKGSKKAAKEKFVKLKEEDLVLMRKHLPIYFSNNPEKKFRKDAERYLSNRLWENGEEIVELPKDWWNMELTQQQWELLTPDQRNRKKVHDMQKQMGI